MVADQRKFRVVEVLRVEKIAIVAPDIVHDAADIRLKNLGFTTKDQGWQSTLQNILQKKNVILGGLNVPG